MASSASVLCLQRGWICILLYPGHGHGRPLLTCSKSASRVSATPCSTCIPPWSKAATSSNPTTDSSPSPELDLKPFPQSKEQQKRVWSSGEVVFLSTTPVCFRIWGLSWLRTTHTFYRAEHARPGADAKAAFQLPDRSSQGKLNPLSFNTNNSNSQMKKWHISCLTWRLKL